MLKISSVIRFGCKEQSIHRCHCAGRCENRCRAISYNNYYHFHRSNIITGVMEGISLNKGLRQLSLEVNQLQCLSLMIAKFYYFRWLDWAAVELVMRRISPSLCQKARTLPSLHF